MAKTRQEVVDQVKKLLALGQSDNEHESAAAIGRANALMEEYRITAACMAEKKDEEEDVQGWDDPLSTSNRDWQRHLARVLASANGCSTWISRVQGNASINIIGKPSNVQTVRYLYNYCIKEIDRLAHGQRGNGRNWIHQYRNGCVDAIEESIELESNMLCDRIRGTKTGSELMVINNAIVVVKEEHLHAKEFGYRHLGLRRIQVGSGAGINPSARGAGQKDGKNIYPGVGGSTKIGGGVRRIG